MKKLMGKEKERARLMIKTSLLRIVSACAAGMVAHAGAAQISDVDLLTCNFAKEMQPFPSAYWDHLHFHKTQEGSFVIPGPVREQELCIQNATMSAAFGVYMVQAELCNTTTQPLLDWLAKNRPSLQRSNATTRPEIIVSFGTEKDSLIVFHGRASNGWKLDPAERQLAFACGVVGSGAQ